MNITFKNKIQAKVVYYNYSNDISGSRVINIAIQPISMKSQNLLNNINFTHSLPKSFVILDTQYIDLHGGKLTKVENNVFYFEGVQRPYHNKIYYNLMVTEKDFFRSLKYKNLFNNLEVRGNTLKLSISDNTNMVPLRDTTSGIMIYTEPVNSSLWSVSGASFGITNSRSNFTTSNPFI